MSDSPARNSFVASQVSARGFPYLRIALGLFLLSTAGLKAHGLTLDPLAQDSFLASPRLLVATIELEIILGVWLLSGWWAQAGWAVTLGFFGILAGASLYLAVEGQASCGCFGRLTVAPWATFGLDVLVAIGLLICRPVSARGKPSNSWVRRAVQLGIGTVAFLAIIGGGLVLAFGDPDRGLALLRGESITVEPSVSQVGQGQRGQEGKFAIQLINNGNRSVRVIGGTTSCSCIATGDLPITLGPGESQPMEVQLRFQGRTGRFQHRFVLYTDDEKQPVVTARFAGRVVERE